MSTMLIRRHLLSILCLLAFADRVEALDCVAEDKPICESIIDCEDANNLQGINGDCGELTCDAGTCEFNAWVDTGNCFTTNFLECGGNDALCTKGPSELDYDATCTGWSNNECIYQWCPPDDLVPTTSPSPTATPLTSATLETMVVTDVGGGDSWKTVLLSESYVSPIPVCSVEYSDPSDPVVVRMRQVGSTSFQIKLQNPGDIGTVVAKTVNCLVVEEGKWQMPDGRMLEARSYTSTITDRKGSWTGETQSYGNAYQNPVVVGQVMTFNDSGWSVFWSSSPGSKSDPPTAAGLATGKHVGEDTVQTRVAETIGVIVMESGHGTSPSYEAGLGGDIVQGVDNSASGYSYTYSTPFQTSPMVKIVSQAGMDGGDGGWAVLTGGQSNTALQVVIDEDQIGDSERNHATEQVAYIVFEDEGSIELIAVGASQSPSLAPSMIPSAKPTALASEAPTPIASEEPTVVASEAPTGMPSESPTVTTSMSPTSVASASPTTVASAAPTVVASASPTTSASPSVVPSEAPTPIASEAPTAVASEAPTGMPSESPSVTSSMSPTAVASASPTAVASAAPTVVASASPTTSTSPSVVPSEAPTPIASEAPTVVVSESPTVTASMSPTAVPSASPSTSANWLETIVVTDVGGGDSWQTVSLSESYVSPIPVCSVEYNDPSDPVVVRMRQVGSASFQIKLQNPGDIGTVVAKTVNCLVVEEGKWQMPDGRVLEARSYTSTITDRKGSWTGETQSYGNAYQNPVVVGQVMTFNDSGWSVFWSSSPGFKSNPPTAAGLATGKHVGEDTVQTRAAETIGVIVMESGHGTSPSYEAGLGGDTVQGVDNSATGYSYAYSTPFQMTPMVKIVSQAGMDGGDGGWAVLTGGQSNTALQVVIDEDQIGDSERSHTTEQVAYIVFEDEGSIELTGFPTAPPTSGIWQPGPGLSWQWQLQGTIDTSFDVDVYDIDLFDVPQTVIDQLHSDGRIVICYFSAGTYEDWRPDAGNFPPEVLGNPLDEWPGERYLDIRNFAVLGPIMQARLDLAVAKECDAVEPDNVDAYTNNNGLGLSANDQLEYNRFIATEAHLRNLSVGLKNDLDQVPDLIDDFDWALNEECYRYNECDVLTPFINAGKAVFGVEYRGNPAVFCPELNSMQFSWLKKNLDLTATVVADCRDYS